MSFINLDFLAVSFRKILDIEFKKLIDCICSSVEPNIVINLEDKLSYDSDFQKTLTSLLPNVNRHTRIIIKAYSPYLRWLYKIANKLKIRDAQLPTTFVTKTTLSSICKLSDCELVKLHPTVIFPFYLGGFGLFINGLLRIIPLVDKLAITTTAIIRPVINMDDIPTASILIPARNEKGNIENALKRIPDYFTPERTEIIFVEGHSSDGTFEEINRVAKLYTDRFTEIKVIKQTGKGKVDAVRTGFAVANMEVLAILDADLTMPPELLPRFFEAYRKGLADFINGDRLVYKMEGKAMKFLNRLGNIFFAKALSFVLNLQLGDVLCGTKVFARHDYQRFVAWRKSFGDFDPFGDFELLFPASQLGLSVINLPIKYLDRTYGETNIHRFRDGFRLLKMTLVGLFRVKAGL